MLFSSDHAILRFPDVRRAAAELIQRSGRYPASLLRALRPREEGGRIPAEKWQRGRMHTPAKGAGPNYGPRGFESPLLRQLLSQGATVPWLFYCDWTEKIRNFSLFILTVLERSCGLQAGFCGSSVVKIGFIWQVRGRRHLNSIDLPSSLRSCR